MKVLQTVQECHHALVCISLIPSLPYPSHHLQYESWECGRLGVWEAGSVGGWECGRLGVWEAGDVGGWDVGGWECGRLHAEDVKGCGCRKLELRFVCYFICKQAAEMTPFSLIIWGSLSHQNVCFQVHNLHVAGLYFPQSCTLLRGVQENLQHTSHMNVT